MTNPAQALLTLLDDWSGRGTHPPERARGVGAPEVHRFWQEQNRGVALLLEIERELDELAESRPDLDIDLYRRSLVDAYKAVYGMKPRWGEALRQGSNETIRILANRDGLNHVANLLAMREQRFSYTKDQREALVEQIGGALQEVHDAAYLPAAAKAQLLEVLGRAMRIASDPLSADRAVRSAVAESSGTFLVTAQTADVPHDARRALFKRAWDFGLKVTGDASYQLAKDKTREMLELGAKALQDLT
jgi:hypothetical protein